MTDPRLHPDRMPRRKVLVAGTFACAVMLALNAAFSARWAAYAAGEQNLVRSLVSIVVLC